MKIKIEEIAAHRNGICGDPFVVVKFKDTDKKSMLAILFYSGDCQTAVFDMDLLKQDIIAFGKNSHRGDHYDNVLRKAVKEWEENL